MAGQAAQVEQTGALQRKGTESERERASPSAARGAVVNTGPRGKVKQQQRRFFLREYEREREYPSTNPQKLKTKHIACGSAPLANDDHDIRIKRNEKQRLTGVKKIKHRDVSRSG